MRRTELQLRRPNSQAEHYSAQLRSGIKVPGLRNIGNCDHKEKIEFGSLWSERVCPCVDYQHGEHKFLRSEVDLLTVLEVRAFCGDMPAREVLGDLPVPGDSGNCVLNYDYFDNPENLTPWLRHLLELAEHLPDIVVDGVVCKHNRLNRREECIDCNGSDVGQAVKTKAPRYLAACIGLAVGQAILPERVIDDCNCRDCSSTRALNTCGRYTWCPCSENAEACDPNLSGLDARAVPWLWWLLCIVYEGDLTIASLMIQDATALIETEAVCRAARLMVLSCIG